MKSKMTIFVLIGALIIGSAWPLMAEDIYVTGVTKITMRTGPGTDHKIVEMLSSGTKLTIQDHQPDWSQVTTQDGKSGWVLTRFLTKDVPKALLVEQLKGQNSQLKADLEAAESRADELQSKYDALAGIEKKYMQLQKASSDYLKLDATHKALLETSKSQQERIRFLEGQVDKEELYWALAGAFVFIIGLVIGVSSRKKKRNSLL